MANHASALKAHRQSVTRAKRNRSRKSALRSTLKKYATHIQESRIDSAKASLPELYATLDKATRRKALSRNAAARQKSRLTRRLNRAAAAAAKP